MVKVEDPFLTGYLIRTEWTTYCGSQLHRIILWLFSWYTLCVCVNVLRNYWEISLPNWQLVKTKNKSERKIKMGSKTECILFFAFPLSVR